MSKKASQGMVMGKKKKKKDLRNTDLEQVPT